MEVGGGGGGPLWEVVNGCVPMVFNHSFCREVTSVLYLDVAILYSGSSAKSIVADISIIIIAMNIIKKWLSWCLCFLDRLLVCG